MIVLVWDGHVEIQTQREESHVKTGAEITARQLYAEGHQGLPATTEEKGIEQTLPHRLQKEPTLFTP